MSDASTTKVVEEDGEHYQKQPCDECGKLVRERNEETNIFGANSWKCDDCFGTGMGLSKTADAAIWIGILLAIFLGGLSFLLGF